MNRAGADAAEREALAHQPNRNNPEAALEKPRPNAEDEEEQGAEVGGAEAGGAAGGAAVRTLGEVAGRLLAEVEVGLRGGADSPAGGCGSA